MEIEKINTQTDINVDSLWLIDERDKTGKHKNVYHGNFIPQIPNQLIRRYTKEQEIILELFAGSGTTLFECEKLNRKYIGFDINLRIVDYIKTTMKNDFADNYYLNCCDSLNGNQISENTIKNIMKKYGCYDLVKKQYQRFKADKNENRNHKADSTFEYLHILEKNK